VAAGVAYNRAMTTPTSLLLSIALLSAAGCNQERTGTGDAVAAMARFKDKMCACKDPACAKSVSAEMVAWGTEQAKAAGAKVPTPTEADAKALGDLGKALGECATAIEKAAKAAEQTAEKQ